MAKGQAAKQETFATIMSMFPDSFMYNSNKELRINTTDNGEPVQLKIVITCAAKPVSADEESAVPNAITTKVEDNAGASSEAVTRTEPSEVKASSDEIQRINDLMKSLGI